MYHHSHTLKCLVRSSNCLPPVLSPPPSPPPSCQFSLPSSANVMGAVQISSCSSTAAWPPPPLLYHCIALPCTLLSPLTTATDQSYVCVVFVLHLCCVGVICVVCLCYTFVLLYCVCVVLVLTLYSH